MKHQIKIRGIHITYDDYGEGETLVLIHGQPFNRSMWNSQVAALKHQYRLIVPDLRGYGESGKAADPCLLDELALDMLHLLEELNIQQAFFAGLSMGGQVVFELYRLAPHLFKGMILADTDARAETAEGYQKRLQLAADLLTNGMEAYTDATIQQYLCSKTWQHKTDVVADLRLMMVSTNAAGAAAVQKGRAERRDHSGILSSISCPVLVIVGREDIFTPVSTAMEMHAAISTSRLVIIEDASHMPNMEQPALFNAHLKDFLQENCD